MPKCKLCKNLIKDANQLSRFWLECTPHELYQSAHNHNCLSCATLLEGTTLIQADDWSFERDVSTVYGYGLASANDTLALEVYFKDGRPRILLGYFIRYGDNSDSFPWAAIKLRMCINGGPLSQASLIWVWSMMLGCFNRHKCLGRDIKLLPSRILKIMKNHSGEFVVKLAEKSNRFDRYATLSHCWGMQLSCTTTLENISERKCGIPWTGLPETFQDAILYCMELEIHYLWTEALYIIQDSSIDWQQQPNITATVSAFCKDSATPKEYAWDANQPNAIHHLRIRPRLTHWTNPELAHSGQDFPLFTRAWAFQEPVLLHFCKQELVWECREAVQCECGSLTNTCSLKTRFSLIADLERSRTPDGNSTSRYRCNPTESPMLDRYVVDHSGSVAHRSTDNPSEAVHKYWKFAIRGLFTGNELLVEWNRVVAEYSSLKLTKEEERLLALSGLAERMQPHMGRYMAGLWEPSIICGLTWRVDVLQPGTRRPSDNSRGDRRQASGNGQISLLPMGQGFSAAPTSQK
ncbi:hypothetical protein F4801DRAFT_604601 [Xylaria longipes]|nr:hypothetical protein F4801DRAFT_604601 [Xylaria longipes]